MKAMTAKRQIDAPVDRVFRAVAEVEEFKKASPDIVKVEMLSDVRSGVGTRFRETRKMKGREASTVLEITEYAPSERVRFVAESGGALWDSLFAVRPAAGGTELALTMEARPKTFVARLVTPLISGMVAKAVEADMDAVKKYCESRG